MTEARDMFNKDSTTELPPYAYDMRPEVEWPMRKKDGAGSASVSPACPRALGAMEGPPAHTARPSAPAAP